MWPSIPRPEVRRRYPILATTLALAGIAGLAIVAAFVWRGPSADVQVEKPLSEPIESSEAHAASQPVARPAALGDGAATARVESVPPPEPEAMAAARRLIDRLTALLASAENGWTEEHQKKLAEIEAELLALGEAATPALLARLDSGQHTQNVRDALFNVLRRLPGREAETRIAHEARHAGERSLRTMAIEALAQRKSGQAIDTLATIARNDPYLPSEPLLVSGPRDPNIASTTLPDEAEFTPRMLAMQALAETKDPRAAGILADVLRTGPDESIRMEAARHLKEFRSDPRADEALRTAALSDPSAYVRLSALHSLNGSTDMSLVPLLQQIIASDKDAGVRALAQEVLDSVQRR